jgi:hypothetical protein
MRLLAIVALMILVGWLPNAAHAQSQPQADPQPAPVVVDQGYDFGLQPVVAVLAGAAAGVVLASTIAGGLITGAALLDGVSFTEALEAGTGLRVPVIGASAVLGGFAGHFLFSR